MARTEQAHEERLAARRRSRSLEKLPDALAHELAVPPPVTEIRKSHRGTLPLLSADALELARQVYYLNSGSIADAARAILASGLVSDVDDRVQDPLTVICGRLRTWWRREQWPKRPTKHTYVIRDAANDGGLFRSARRCAGVTTGSGPAPAGKPCGGPPLPDSTFCWQHDPRPEYVARRGVEGRRLAASRVQDMVPIGPLAAWMDSERRRLLKQHTGQLHANHRGWGLLADRMGWDPSLMGRVMNGATSARPTTTRGQIRASTAARYLANAGTSFEEVYGFSQPPARREYDVCPGCGEQKNHQSKLCRSCHEAGGVRCGYVNGRGEQCPRRTHDPSGHCYVCRRILERRANPRPRRGRTTFVTVPMLILAAEAYLENPNLRWVAWQRMWPVNAAGCRDVFKSAKSLESGLVKQFRKRGWSESPDGGAALRAHASRELVLANVRDGLKWLIADHGPVPWPEAGAQRVLALESAAWLPLAPFRVWLARRYAEVGSYKGLQERVAIADDSLSKIVRGVGRKGTAKFVLRATVERALELWGEGETVADVYGSGR